MVEISWVNNKKCPQMQMKGVYGDKHPEDVLGKQAYSQELPHNVHIFFQAVSGLFLQIYFLTHALRMFSSLGY